MWFCIAIPRPYIHIHVHVLMNMFTIHILVSIMHVPTAAVYLISFPNISDLIVLAGFIRNTIAMDVFIHPARVSSITVSSSTTVDEYLWGKVNLRE